jgi:hypothetical protein
MGWRPVDPDRYSAGQRTVIDASLSESSGQVSGGDSERVRLMVHTASIASPL